MIDNIILLYAANLVKKHLAWYLMNQVISESAARNLHEQINNLIKKIGKFSLDICESFGIPRHLLTAPIYTGIEEYYKTDVTNGEHWNIKGRPKF
jgi:hypothetical protein